jgi:phosphatidylglycerophosphate synthase
MSFSLLQSIPWLLIVLRVLCCPLIVIAAYRDWPGPVLGLIILVALFSDIYDGIFARRWNCETSTLRVTDSIADTIFYLGVLAALWVLEPQVLRGNWKLLAALLSLEAFRYLFDLAKFRRAASYHSYLAKSWGLVLAVAVLGVLNFGGLRPLIWVALILGIVVNLEGLAMSLMLPRWQNDVKTLRAAWVLRQQMFRDSASQRHPH